MSFRSNIKEHGTVHLVWIILILVAALIAVLSVKLGTNSELKDILNFAVASASLVLAIIAIVQALLSGVTLSEAVSQIRNSLSEINQPAAQIAKAASAITNYSEKIDDHATTINDSAKVILDRIVMRGPDSVATDDPTYEENDVLANISESGKLALYIVLKSFESKTPVEASMIKGASFEDWIYGYIMALSSLSLIGSKQQDNNITVTDLGKFSWIQNSREKLKEFDSQDVTEYLAPALADIDKHYL